MVAKSTSNSKEFTIAHAKIPHADMEWALQQSPTVLRLWVESWRADSFGTATSRPKPQWHTLKTNLQGSNLRAAIRAIELAGLFKYDPIYQKTEKGQRRVVGWVCSNLHGHFSLFWKVDDDSGKLDGDSGKLDDDSGKLDGDSGKLDDDSGDLQAENVVEQSLENFQLLINNSSTTPLSLTNVIKEESSDPVAATEPPFEGAIPAAVGGDEGQNEEEGTESFPVASRAFQKPLHEEGEVTGEDDCSGAAANTEEIRRRTREDLQRKNPGIDPTKPKQKTSTMLQHSRIC